MILEMKHYMMLQLNHVHGISPEVLKKVTDVSVNRRLIIFVMRSNSLPDYISDNKQHDSPMKINYLKHQWICHVHSFISLQQS